MNLEEVAARFEARRSGANYAARCPLHDDQHPSLSISPGDDGGTVLLCHACGKEATEAILAARELTFADLRPSNGNGHSRAGANTVYVYRDENGKDLFHVCRTPEKKFFQQKPDGSNGIKGVRRVLYRLPEILKADPTTTVWIVEGEKDVDRLRALGLVATCNPGGAGKWREEYNVHLKGRPIFITPDNDQPGRDHAIAVARAMHGTAASVRVVHLPGLKNHDDVTDFLAAGHTVDELRALAEATPDWSPTTTSSDDVQKHIDSGVANMERLIAQHHPDVRYLKNVGWYSWDGRRFAPDAEPDLVRRAIRTVRAMYHEAADIEDEKKRTAFSAHIRKTESEPEIRRMVLLAQSDEKIYVPMPEYFDADPMLLNLHNGTLNLKTRELHPHRQEDRITKLAGCAYDSQATCPTFDAFIHRMLDGDTDMIAFLQRLVGYWITGEIREHVLPIFWGDGANGRSTLIDNLQRLLGDYASQAPPNLLVLLHHKAHPTELTELIGARFVPTVETDRKDALNETLVKTLTGGDTLKARRMYRDFVEFRPTHKLVMVTNHKPRIDGTDYAIWRRVLLVPFNVVIPEKERDGHLPNKLATELPGVLNWALRGCLEWQANGLNPPAKVKAATETYRQESDHLATFIDEMCVVKQFARVEKRFIFLAYDEWCLKNSETPMPKVELGRRLKAIGATDDRSHGKHFWSGIGIAAKDEAP